MRSWLVVVLLVACSLSAFPQSIPLVINENFLELKVKQIDEFMHRFNFDTRYDGSIPGDSVSLEERLKNMYTVFKVDRFKTQEGKPNELITGLCKYAIDNKIHLLYEDKNWKAEVVCNALLERKKEQVSVFLQTEQIEGLYYKWVLVGVDGRFMDSFQKPVKDSLFISPAEHGISFMTLPRIVKLNVEGVKTLFNKDWKPDPLSVFSYLICTEKLVLKSTERVMYHWNLGKYSFKVERFEGEDSPNQGWLISEVTANP